MTLRSHIALSVAQGFVLLSTAGRLHPNARPERHGITAIRDIPYREGGAAHHTLDIYRPDKVSGPLPVVLYLHGGGFRACSKETHWLFALAFARRGCLVFQANYRLAPEFPFPAAPDDACAALLWVRQNAHRWGGDPDRIVVAGESAGGNLVSCLAIATSWRRPEPWAQPVFDAGIRLRGVIAAYGALQVTDPQRLIRRKPGMPWLIQQVILDLPETYLRGSPTLDLAMADPLCVIEGASAAERPLPPFFLPVGTADPLLPDTRRMAEALDRHGVTHHTRYHPGELHGFHGFIWRREAKLCWQGIYEFLDSVAS